VRADAFSPPSEVDALILFQSVKPTGIAEIFQTSFDWNGSMASNMWTESLGPLGTFNFSGTHLSPTFTGFLWNNAAGDSIQLFSIINPQHTLTNIVLAVPGQTWQVSDGSIDVTSTPEPASLLLLGTGLLAIGSWKKIRDRRKHVAGEVPHREVPHRNE
jgi:hypothetical protein